MSNRMFGSQLTVLLTFLAFALLYFKTSSIITLSMFGAAGITLLATVRNYRALESVHRFFMVLSNFLSRIFNPLMMSAVYWLLFTPFAMKRRLKKQNRIKTSQAKILDTYWQNPVENVKKESERWFREAF